ncbi:MAG: Rrf2 family transcriptional regulator [Spirochaetia bacterium]|nr:Rrf2 family transcriptional regulator [Spirochaetia bacterium]
MNISTKGRYALRSLTHLADSYAKRGNAPVSIKDISGKESISNRYLENIFVALRKAGLVTSMKGEKGGFKLAMAPEKITIFDILSAVEKGTATTKCASDFDFCNNAPNCGIRKVWVKLDRITGDFLRSTSLAEVTGTHMQMGKKKGE